MACSHRNLIINGDFRGTIAPWTGKQIRRVRNPVDSGDYSILMGSSSGKAQSILSQQNRIKLESECAYYLTFRLINVSPDKRPANFFATVAYLNTRRTILRSTPLLVLPPKTKTYRSYFSIVPPPPRGTTQVKIVFLLQSGQLYVDMVRLASHDV